MRIHLGLGLGSPCLLGCLPFERPWDDLGMQALGLETIGFWIPLRVGALGPSTSSYSPPLLGTLLLLCHFNAKRILNQSIVAHLLLLCPHGHLDTDAVLAKIIHAGKSSLRREASKYKGTCQLPIKAEFYKAQINFQLAMNINRICDLALDVLNDIKSYL